MNCREFREKHVGFVDDTLAGVELVEMRRHLDECHSCAELHTKVKRALLLVRNLPTIEISAGFTERLNARLAECRNTEVPARLMRKRIAAAVTLAAAAMIGYIAITLDRVERSSDLVMPPVVATRPESDMAPLASPPAALVASVPAGLAIWPAALFAEEAPVRFAHARFASAAATR
ncbi:MAG: zf-HC2 domain-containing protein [Gemmatimonadaceae bacterium]|nr:zf-HC2 domain-containing protein [Gemmatimonadaceae bacterium]